MKAENFVYWLQGHIELNGEEVPTEEQWKVILEHHKLCLIKVTTETITIPSSQPFCSKTTLICGRDK